MEIHIGIVSKINLNIKQKTFQYNELIFTSLGLFILLEKVTYIELAFHFPEESLSLFQIQSFPGIFGSRNFAIWNKGGLSQYLSQIIFITQYLAPK